jgi:hypothetical protein
MRRVIITCYTRRDNSLFGVTRDDEANRGEAKPSNQSVRVLMITPELQSRRFTKATLINTFLAGTTEQVSNFIFGASLSL